MFKLKRSHWRVLLAVGVSAALIAPANAVAQDALSNPSAAQYQPQSQVQGTSGGGGSVAADTSTGSPAAVRSAAAGPSGSLPFTGMDLAVVAGIAVLMIGVGFGLRRLSEPRAPGI
jgi:hypothetical protein